MREGGSDTINISLSSGSRDRRRWLRGKRRKRLSYSQKEFQVVVGEAEVQLAKLNLSHNVICLVTF